jgi:hypothetical protein
LGEEQVLQSLSEVLSSLHSNLALASGEEKLKLAERLATVPVGPESMLV